MELVDEWKSEAERLRTRHGLLEAATTMDSAAADLEDVLRDLAERLVKIDEAVEISDYSRPTIERKLASGEIKNHGVPGAPLMRLMDLPLKAGRASRTLAAMAAQAPPGRRLKASTKSQRPSVIPVRFGPRPTGTDAT
jgi:hypothetical protein